MKANKATQFVKLIELLKKENTEQRCSVRELDDILNFENSRYYNNNLTRGNADILLKEIEAVLEKENLFAEKFDKIMKSKKIKDFIKKNKRFISGYSMGETVEIIVTDGINSKTVEIMNDKKEYKGAARRYNNRIQYGYCNLIADVSNARTKFTVDIYKK